MSEHNFRQLDQEYGRIEDRSEKGRCLHCGCLLIRARGVAGEPMEIFQIPICPNCGWGLAQGETLDKL